MPALAVVVFIVVAAIAVSAAAAVATDFAFPFGLSDVSFVRLLSLFCLPRLLDLSFLDLVLLPLRRLLLLLPLPTPPPELGNWCEKLSVSVDGTL